MQDHYADHLTMGTGNGEPGGGVYQGGESAYGDCTRRSTASNETGDAGTLVRHRAGYGDGRVWTEWQGTAGTGAVCCTRVDTEEVKASPPTPLLQRGEEGDFYKNNNNPFIR